MFVTVTVCFIAQANHRHRERQHHRHTLMSACVPTVESGMRSVPLCTPGRFTPMAISPGVLLRHLRAGGESPAVVGGSPCSAASSLQPEGDDLERTIIKPARDQLNTSKTGRLRYQKGIVLAVDVVLM